MTENMIDSAATEPQSNEAGDGQAAASLEFNSVGLSESLQRAVAAQGYTMMTPIQAKAIPIVLAGRDVMGAAQTGTGKTAAFSIPLLQKMLRHENTSASPARHPVRALVLAPTRELADQVAANVKAYAKHTLLRSATFSPEIKRLAESYLQDPVLVEVARPNATATNVEQRFYSVSPDDKRAAVLKLLKERSLGQALVFVNSKLGCARLARSFERDGLRTNALHGDKSQDERLKALDAFKRGDVDVLVATDVAARGLDIADLPGVFNFDVPFNAEDYVHRIGRTGRAGASGLAITLVSRDDTRLTSDIEKLIKKKIELEPLELDDDRPLRRPRRDDGDESRERALASRDYRPRTPAPAPRDPFFDQPYVPNANAEEPLWDKKAAPAAAPARSGLSAYIKPKKKVAALFGAKKAAETA